MVQRVLVPLDGSPFGEIAIPVAIELAKRTHGAVRLIRVYEPWSKVVPPPEAIVLSGEDEVALREIEVKYLEDVVSRVAPTAPIAVTSTFAEGLTGPTLTKQSAAWPADIVVMTTHGRGPLSRFWLGSVADYLVRHGSTPILLLRPKDEVDWAPADLGIRRILAVTDFSAQADTILEPAGEIAKLFGGEIELANVVEPVMGYVAATYPYPIPTAPEIDEMTRRIAEEQLERRAELLKKKGVAVTTNVLFGTGVAGTLLARIAESRPDLVAITTHGRTGWRRAVLGSVADKLIRGAGRPLLVVPPPATVPSVAESPRTPERAAVGA